MDYTQAGIVILDCTLRDGGYYTNWTFDSDLVRDYLSTLETLPVNVIELGFAGKGSTAGRFANVDGRLAARLDSGGRARFAVMIDAKDYFDSNEPLVERLRADIGSASQGSVEVVRVAVHYSAVAQCRDLCAALHDLGYVITLNLMQLDLANQYELGRCIEALWSIDDADIVYVADSLGSMLPRRVEYLVARLRTEVEGPIGFHAHNNRGLAVLNSMHAQKSGARWIDCTVCGMGRGAGNAPTEELLPLLVDEIPPDLEVALQSLAAQHFEPLRETYGWGASVHYAYAAIQAIHPMYVQRLSLDDRVDSDHLFRCLLALSDGESAGFDAARLEAVISNTAARGIAVEANIGGRDAAH